MPPSANKSEANDTPATPKGKQAASKASPSPDAKAKPKGSENLNANRANEIATLLEALENTTDTNEKKKIRRSLRAKGHYGGLQKRDVDKQRHASKMTDNA